MTVPIHSYSSKVGLGDVLYSICKFTARGKTDPGTLIGVDTLRRMVYSRGLGAIVGIGHLGLLLL